MQQSARAEEMAAELKLLNEERKDMTQAGMEQAFEQVDAELADDDVLVIYLPDCHESLAGIIAGRVRENYNKPSFVLTRGEDCVKGSGRSIESYHMYQALCGVQDLLLKFGGHPMAAGFSLKEENIDEFRRRLNEQSALTKEDFIPKIWIDVAMPLEYISEALVNELKGPGTLRPGQRKASVCPEESPYPKRACHRTKQQCGPHDGGNRTGPSYGGHGVYRGRSVCGRSKAKQKYRCDLLSGYQ